MQEPVKCPELSRGFSLARNASLNVRSEFVLLNPPHGGTEMREGRDFVTVDPAMGDPKQQADLLGGDWWNQGGSDAKHWGS